MITLLCCVCYDEKQTKTQLNFIFFSSPEHEVLSELLCSFNVRRPCIRASTISLNNISSETAYWILTKLHRNDPWVVPYQSSSNRSSWLHKNRSRGQKIGFQNAIFKNLLVRNYKAQSFHIWYIASSRCPLPKLFKLCPWGQN